MKRNTKEYDKIAMLYELYEGKMYVVAYAILRDSQWAEDAVSEAFIRLMKYRNKIKDVESDDTKRLVIKVVKTAALDLYRKEQNARKHISLVSDEDTQSLAEPGDVIDALIGALDSKHETDKLLAHLPLAYREVVECRVLRQLTVKETAAVLQISEATVRKRYERARNFLAKKKGVETYAYKPI